MSKTTKIRQAARGQECQVRIPGVCNFNPDTTILAHVNGGGAGMKNPDYMATFCCSDCHDVVDGRRKTEYPKSTILNWFYEGVFRTQKILVDMGLIIIK